MIKEYFIGINRTGHKYKMARIICDSCSKPFEISEKVALRGRKYCNIKCNYKGRGFKIH